MAKKATDIPTPVIRRLSRYLALMQYLCKKNMNWVSSQKVARHLGLTSVTVRQDLKYLDFTGVGKRGYDTTGLKSTLIKFFSADIDNSAIIVGAGHLGQALIQHKEFLTQGFKICAVCDVNPEIIGTKAGPLVVQSTDDLQDIVRENKIQIGIIAVPREEAQQVADQLILAGINGLLNLSPEHLASRRTVPVVDVRMIDSLRELVYKIKKTTGL